MHEKFAPIPDMNGKFHILDIDNQKKKIRISMQLSDVFDTMRIWRNTSKQSAASIHTGRATLNNTTTQTVAIIRIIFWNKIQPAIIFNILMQ